MKKIVVQPYKYTGIDLYLDLIIKQCIFTFWRIDKKRLINYVTNFNIYDVVPTPYHQPPCMQRNQNKTIQKESSLNKDRY